MHRDNFTLNYCSVREFWLESQTLMGSLSSFFSLDSHLQTALFGKESSANLQCDSSPGGWVKTWGHTEGWQDAGEPRAHLPLPSAKALSVQRKNPHTRIVLTHQKSKIVEAEINSCSLEGFEIFLLSYNCTFFSSLDGDIITKDFFKLQCEILGN